jgi:hypothetical protein
LERLALENIRDFNARQICAIMYAYSFSQVRPSKTMTSRCLSQIARHASSLTCSQVTHVLRSFVSLKLHPSEFLLHKLSQRFIVHEDEARAPPAPPPTPLRNMIATLHLYAQLRTRPHAALLDMYTERISQSLFMLNTSDLADFIWSLAVFDLKPGVRDMPVILKRVKELFRVKPSASNDTFVKNPPHSVDKSIQILWSLAKFQETPSEFQEAPSDQLRRMLEESILAGDGQFTVEDVARLLWSNSVLHDDMDARLKQMLDGEITRLRTVPTDSTHLKMMLTAYVNMKSARMPSSSAAMIWVSMRACMSNNIAAVDFAETLDMIARLHVPVFTYLHEQLNRTAALKTRELDAKNAVTVLYALHRLGVPLTSEYLNEVSAHMLTNMQDMQAEHVCKVLQTISALVHTGPSWREPPGVQTLIGALETCAELLAPKFTREEKREMVLAFSALNLRERRMADGGDA